MSGLFIGQIIIPKGDNNNANIQTGTRASHQRRHLPENPALFHQLCGARPATLLLESADIDSKDDLKSLLLVDSALRITALGDTVTIQALSANGAALLAAGWRAALRHRQSASAQRPHLTFRRSAPCSMKTPASAHCRCLTPSVCCRSW
jgi:anthranilate/para-aminobenzoate synthase component I